MSNILIAPSVLAADFANLQRDIEMVNNSQADWFHIDVMDGHFVPNISYGMPVIEAIKKHATKPLDVHLMIEKPERYIEIFKQVGADIITVHHEATVHLHRTLRQIKDAGCKAGVVLNLSTPVSVLEDILPITINRVKKLRKMIDEQGLDTLIEIDGGVNQETGQRLVNAGANVLVAGSYVFGNANPVEAIAGLKNMLKV
jgi:ribulose-phosphate 3-epimerase